MWRAHADPGIALLPRGDGEWARQIEQDVVDTSPAPARNEADFRRTYDARTVEGATTLRIRAFGAIQVSVNERALAPLTVGSDWKHVTEFALPVVPGTSVLSVKVRNQIGIPLLQVLAPPALRTPVDWLAARGPSFADAAPVVSPLHRPPRPGPLQQLPAWRGLRYVVAAWIFGSIAGVAVAGFRMLRRPTTQAPPTLARVMLAAPIVLVATVALVNSVNVISYPAERRPVDWDAHADYVRYVARHWTVPPATDGWEMYQPPLYYFCAALIEAGWGAVAAPEAAMRAVQMLGVAAAVGLALVAHAMARALMPGDGAGRLVATGFAALVPMSVYMAPVVSNETFAACAIAIAIHRLVLVLRTEAPSMRAVWVAGAAAGIGLLSKYPAVIVAAAGMLLLSRRAAHRQAEWTAPMTFAVVTGAAAGWLYVRNLVSYGTPFIGNWDHASAFQLVQEPSFRPIEFFTRFGAVFFQHPTRSIWTSWLDGMYATMWADAHSALVPLADERAFLGMGVLLAVAFLPTITIVLGFVAVLIDAVREDDAAALLVLVSVWTWIALIWFTLRIPAYSTVKAFYFLSLTPTLGLFLARGRRVLGGGSRWARWTLDVAMVVVAVLVLTIYVRPY